ncbi:hypothetical protein GIB67_034844 [Kingdonia uniflora]|uniref:Cadmium-induced protein AS8 n=1 Tax=Kingdonia uniflora TaxID=39325 RepID=A0A7J7ME89_9MAGN|nr:hypothetical protein GIB67_034844 [Kingdonia uniflora]
MDSSRFPILLHFGRRKVFNLMDSSIFIVQVLMIIKGLLRKYERWNPVHPTSGAFWGMGIGIGCGVGWGPGFGPEVIGYVGAGCGVGFSVGITLAGVGIGLPANCLIEFPYNGAPHLFSYSIKLLMNFCIIFSTTIICQNYRNIF